LPAGMQIQMGTEVSQRCVCTAIAWRP
jgi:hypothetical protein